jgi:hypothetical protein
MALAVQGSVGEVLWQEEEKGKMIDNSIWRRGVREVELTEARRSAAVAASQPVRAATVWSSARMSGSRRFGERLPHA